MKNKYLIRLLFTIIVAAAMLNGYSQNIQYCPFGPNYESAISNDTVHRQMLQARFARLHDQSTVQHIVSTQSVGPLIIPVVVHVIHLNTEAVGQGLNMPYAQVESQIDRLNADYANDTVYTQLPSGQWAVNTGIQFCLAKNPAGPASWSNNAEPGVMRYGVSNSTIYNQIYNVNNQSTVNQLLSLTHPAPNYFPFGKYLNIWTVNQITDGGSSQYGGYSPLPILNIPFPLDGIIIDAHMFGDNTVNGNSFPLIYASYNSGNILAHEVGHYLSLEHTFRNGCAGMLNSDCASDGDFICDTPPNNSTGASCNYFNTCNETSLAPWGDRPDMIENFMTWADDNCLNTFTNEQGIVLRNYLTLYRTSLVSDTNLATTGVAGPGGCIPPVLSASFTFPSSICVNTSVTFNAYTGAGFSADLFQWTFTSGSPATSNQISPSVSFANAGPQMVILTATDTSTNTSVTDSFAVYVSPCAALQSTMGNWYFGKRAGVSFATGVGQPDDAAWINHSIVSPEATLSLSDSSGALIFISDGDTVWDRNHQPVIPNLAGNYGDSKSQIIYAPHPTHPNWYYLFYGPALESYNGTINYSIISDTNGTIVPVQLNDTLPRALTQPDYGEYITAVPHCNGRDTWIIASGNWWNDTIGNNTSTTMPWAKRLCVFLVSPAGVTNPNGVSPYPYVYTLTNGQYLGQFGQMKASRDGTKLAFPGGGGLMYTDFDPSTGIISNDHWLTYNGYYKYGLSFSPNSHIVYFSDPSTNLMMGVDLTASAPSITTLFTTPYTSWDLQLGPDSMLYLAYADRPELGRMTNPNNMSSPGFVPLALTLNSNYPQIRSKDGLPNFIEAKRPAPAPLNFTASFQSCNTVAFNFGGCWHSAYSFLWDFGDNTTANVQNPTHTYAASGTYTVTLTVSIGSGQYPVMSQVIVIQNSPPVISGPSGFCSGSINPAQYSLPSGFQSYSWSTTGGGNIITPTNQSSVQASWISNGTISCVVSNGANCTYTVSLAVTFYQSPIANAAATDTIPACAGGVVTLGGAPTASGGTSPYFYQWSPSSATTSNPQATVGTSSITFTVLVTDANGCTASDIVVVIPDSTLPLPPVSFDPIPQHCDNGLPFSLAGYGSPTGGIYSGTGVVGNSYVASNAGGPGVYTITYTVTDASTGCQNHDTSSITLYACCNPAANGINTADGDLSSAYGTQFSSSPVPVRINGTFYVDNNFSILNYNGTNSVRCAPDAHIVILSGARLLLDSNTVLEACDGAEWRGITIEKGAELDGQGYSIAQEAREAIVSMDGGIFHLYHFTLRKNYRNLIVEPYNGLGLLHQGTIQASHIEGNILALQPHTGIRSLTAVELHSVDSIYIGLHGNSNDANAMNHTQMGISMDSSGAYIQNNEIQYIQTNSATAVPSCCITNSCINPSVCTPLPLGTAISCRNSILFAGGPNSSYENLVKHCTRGFLCDQNSTGWIRNNVFEQISSSNNAIESYTIKKTKCNIGSLDIVDNTASQVSNGILLSFNSYSTSNVQRNHLDDYAGYAIKVLQNKEAPTYIRENELNLNGSVNGKYGIAAQSAVITNTNTYVFIRGNVIRKTEKQIWLTSSKYTEIDSSNVLIFDNVTPAVNTFGIRTQNSAKVLIDGNIVAKSGPQPVNDTLLRDRLFGISVEVNGVNTTVSNNSLQRLGTGINFFGANNYPSSVSCNDLIRNMAGVRMINSSIGEQGAPISASNPSGIAHDNTFTFSSSNMQKTFMRLTNDQVFNWYCRTGASASPTSHPLPATMNPLSAMIMVGNFPNAPQLCSVSGPPQLPQMQSKLVKIALRLPPFDSVPADELYLADQTAFSEIRDDSTLLNQGTPDDTLLRAYYGSLDQTSLGRLDDVKLLASRGDTSLARQKNDGVDPNNCIQQSQKTVNSIYLKTWARGKEEFSPADSTMLLEIAYSNVQHCGTAVYDARVMLGLDVDDYGYDAVARLAGEEPSETERHSGRLYPNPTTGDVTYEIPIEEGQSGRIEVLDILGQQLITAPLKSRIVVLSTSSLACGVYFYRVTLNEQVVDSGKLVITK